MADPETPGTYHVHTHASGAEFWRYVIEIVAFIVAAGWAFYVFVYQERIKPANTPPQGQVVVNLSHHAVHSGAEFVSVSFEIHNLGTVRFRPAGFVVNAYGYRYLPRTTETITRSLSGNVTTLDRCGKLARYCCSRYTQNLPISAQPAPRISSPPGLLLGRSSPSAFRTVPMM